MNEIYQIKNIKKILIKSEKNLKNVYYKIAAFCMIQSFIKRCKNI